MITKQQRSLTHLVFIAPLRQVAQYTEVKHATSHVCYGSESVFNNHGRNAGRVVRLAAHLQRDGAT